MQCVALADSCLALGSSTCRRSHHIIEDCAKAGVLGEGARGIKVWWSYAAIEYGLKAVAGLVVLGPNGSVTKCEIGCLAGHGI